MTDALWSRTQPNMTYFATSKVLPSCFFFSKQWDFPEVNNSIYLLLISSKREILAIPCFLPPFPVSSSNLICMGKQSLHWVLQPTRWNLHFCDALLFFREWRVEGWKYWAPSWMFKKKKKDSVTFGFYSSPRFQKRQLQMDNIRDHSIHLCGFSLGERRVYRREY